MSFNFLRGIGNQHIELGRLIWFCSGVAAIFYAGWAVIVNREPFLPHCLEFGGGMAAILAAGGFGVSQKDNGVANASATVAASNATDGPKE